MVFRVTILLAMSLYTSCSRDAMVSDEIDSAEDGMEITVPEKEAIDEQQPCDNMANYLFVEREGLVNVEFENAEFSRNWRLKTDGNSFSGKGYMVWEGDQYLGNPGNAKATFKIKIGNTGTYQFLWKSAVKTGNSGTDHNDTWLRFNDADDFYAKKDDNIVYPKDTGETPNPEGLQKMVGSRYIEAGMTLISNGRQEPSIITHTTFLWCLKNRVPIPWKFQFDQRVMESIGLFFLIPRKLRKMRFRMMPV